MAKKYDHKISPLRFHISTLYLSFLVIVALNLKMKNHTLQSSIRTSHENSTYIREDYIYESSYLICYTLIFLSG